MDRDFLLKVGLFGLAGGLGALAHSLYIKRKGSESSESTEQLKKELESMGANFKHVSESLTLARTSASVNAKQVAGLQMRLNESMTARGFPMSPVGTIESVFVNKFGTPRQGGLVTDARCRIVWRPELNAHALLDGLTDFSHVWVVFIFHANTNVTMSVKAEDRKKKSSGGNDDEQDGEDADDATAHGGPESSAGSISSAMMSLKSKIRPPRLLGKRVGVFSTRTPHRPNPIGLSVAKVEAIEEDGALLLSGADLIEGTPILDIKPYITAYDAVAEAHDAHWIANAPRTDMQSISWTPDALKKLEELVPKSRFYKSADRLKNAVEATLRLDIRPTPLVKQDAKGAATLFKMAFDVLDCTWSADKDRNITISNVEPGAILEKLVSDPSNGGRLVSIDNPFNRTVRVAAARKPGLDKEAAAARRAEIEARWAEKAGEDDGEEVGLDGLFG